MFLYGDYQFLLGLGNVFKIFRDYISYTDLFEIFIDNAKEPHLRGRIVKMYQKELVCPEIAI